METWEIIVLVIFLILLAAGLGVGIYFVVKYEEDQKKKTQGPTGATGISPPTPIPPPPIGPTGVTGITGNTGGVLTNFSISPQSTPNLYMTFIPNSTDNPRVITSNGSELLCTDYSWSVINNGVNPSLLSVLADPFAADGWSSPLNISNGINIIAGPAILSNSGFAANIPGNIVNWQYTSDKRWCVPTPFQSIVFTIILTIPSV